MGFILFILVAIVLIFVLSKALKKTNAKTEALLTAEEIYKTSKSFLSKIANNELTDAELQKILTSIEGFSRYTDKEQKYKDMFIKELGYEITAKNPHIFVRVKDGDLETFIYSNNIYAVNLNNETKELEISKL